MLRLRPLIVSSCPEFKLFQAWKTFKGLLEVCSDFITFSSYNLPKPPVFLQASVFAVALWHVQSLLHQSSPDFRCRWKRDDHRTCRIASGPRWGRLHRSSFEVTKRSKTKSSATDFSHLVGLQSSQKEIMLEYLKNLTFPFFKQSRMPGGMLPGAGLGCESLESVAGSVNVETFGNVESIEVLHALLVGAAVTSEARAAGLAAPAVTEVGALDVVPGLKCLGCLFFQFYLFYCKGSENQVFVHLFLELQKRPKVLWQTSSKHSGAAGSTISWSKSCRAKLCTAMLFTWWITATCPQLSLQVAFWSFKTKNANMLRARKVTCYTNMYSPYWNTVRSVSIV